MKRSRGICVESAVASILSVLLPIALFASDANSYKLT